MKKRYINNPIAALALVILITGCQREQSATMVNGEHAQHTDVYLDSGLRALLKPVNEQIISSIPVIHADTGSRIFRTTIPGRVTYNTRNNTSVSSRVGGRIEKLYITYNYQPVKRGQRIMEIYSPELVSAQRELLLLRDTGGSNGRLYEKAVRKLRLLGLTQQQIDRIVQTGQPDYRIAVYSPATGYIVEKTAAPAPTSGGGMSDMAADNGMGGGGSSGTGSVAGITAADPVMLRQGQYVSAGQGLFTIYSNNDLIAEFSAPSDVVRSIEPGLALSYHRISDPGQRYTGKIGLVEPTYREGENFTIIRVYGASTALQIGELLKGEIPITRSQGWWLPEEAVLKLGNRAIVFKKEGAVFIPTEVRTGATADGQVQVLDDISNWPVAENAYYLVDSESFIITQKDS